MSLASETQVKAWQALHQVVEGVIPWAQILAWLTTFALADIEKVFAADVQMLPLLTAGKITAAQLIAWDAAALVALAAGQPMPPLLTGN